MQGLVVWFTGLSGAGKTTLARIVHQYLKTVQYPTEMLDGDELRQNLCWDLGFSKEDRNENIRRIGFVSGMLAKHGIVTLVSVISPYRMAREEVRSRMPRNFVEIYVNAPLETCEARDTKGLYRKVRAGELAHFTGIDDPYEVPIYSEIECRTDCETVEQSAVKILDYLARRLHISAPQEHEVARLAVAREPASGDFQI
jgi:adenylyl-sulfate kinase